MTHPLDPLTSDEFRATTALLSAEHGVGEGWRYCSIEGLQPAKADLDTYAADGTVPARVVEVLCLEQATNRTFRGRVDLSADAVLSFEHVPGVQANFTVDEWEEADAALRSHPDVIAALAKRGISMPREGKRLDRKHGENTGHEVQQNPASKCQQDQKCEARHRIVSTGNGRADGDVGKYKRPARPVLEMQSYHARKHVPHRCIAERRCHMQTVIPDDE